MSQQGAVLRHPAFRSGFTLSTLWQRCRLREWAVLRVDETVIDSANNLLLLVQMELELGVVSPVVLQAAQ